jgi:DNA-binding NarL/FixJ family response regulator
MKVLVISDQPLTSIGMRTLLARIDGSVDVHFAISLAEAMQSLCERRYEMMILDLDIQGGRRLSGALLLRQMWPRVALALLSESQRDEEAVRTADFAAVPFLLKTASNRQLEHTFKLLVRRRAVAA